MDGFAEALACFQRGDLAGAEAALAAVLAKTPRHPNALHLMASVRHAQGDGEAAALVFERAAAAAPKDAAIAFNRACVLAELKRHGEAVTEFDRALVLRPGDGEALMMRGVSLAALGRYAEALASYDAALAAGLDRAETHANRGAALAALDRHEEALAAADRALAAAPNDANALFNRGASLVALDRFEEAVRALERAVALSPNAVTRAVRSTAYANVGRFEEALADIDSAIAAAPQRVDFWDRRGHALLMANRYDEALAAYDRVLAANPDDAEATFAKFDVLLSGGDFASGFRLYEARWRMRDAPKTQTSAAPLWLGGEDIAGKTILVQTEQGFGDLFQFCRFIPPLAERGADVVLQERPQTLTLMASLAGVKQLIALGAPAPPVDVRIPMASLMLALGVRVETLPGPIPYLFAEPDRVARWRQRLGQRQKRRVGVCWSGGGRKHMQMARSLDAASLDQLLSAADVEFVSLQFGAAAETALLQRRGVRDFGADIAEFAELAALIETLDLVVSTDTGVAHLAGALGKPVSILLPFHADWRWLRARSDSPWYPTARLFRQRTFGDWTSAIEAVLRQLQ